ncbi:hypothetical protein JVT61DRAFT_3904 [Boletus reticuloceps]|uniref:Uncharacterized protein n=1 Tax=Boletus reticuloceps TaxID=495285 RepID=A0A8I2YPA3_9AGAM|nr:hypothetical protein JVT61DRAFT_3904 [Boletus reticuloceps]
MQLFCSKMANASETYAEMYDLCGSIDPNGTLEPSEMSLAILKQCETVTFPENWSIYYLHEYNCKMKNISLFSNPIFLQFQSKFWYTNNVSPIFRQNVAWQTTPLPILAISAATLACGLRRVLQPQAVGKGKHTNVVRYTAEYHCLQQQMMTGMGKALAHETPR